MTFTRLNSIVDYGAIVLRVSLGIMYLAHAHLKIFTFTLVGTADFFARVGFPGWMAYPNTVRLAVRAELVEAHSPFDRLRANELKRTALWLIP